MTKGFFITFEGGEGSGKSTVIQYVKEKLEELGREVLVTREPGGVYVAESIRDVILNNEMDSMTEALLFAAARKEHLEQKVIPALEKGMIVLCDRFVHSSYVYQGVVGGLGLETVRQLNDIVIGEWMPDATIFLDVDPEVGLKRIHDNGRETNKMDHYELDVHQRIREAYKEIFEGDSRVHTIPADRSIHDVQRMSVGAVLEGINHATAFRTFPGIQAYRIQYKHSNHQAVLSTTCYYKTQEEAGKEFYQEHPKFHILSIEKIGS